MIIVGIVLSFVGFAYLCWLIFALAVHALPFFAGVSAGLAAYHSGSGPVAAIVVGVIAGSIVLVLGQVAFTTLRSSLVRAMLVVLFAVPAAVAGCHAAHGLAQFVIPPRFGATQSQLPARPSWRRRPSCACGSLPSPMLSQGLPPV
jgi:hypothetical protein